MKCPSCGHENVAETDLCRNCGARLRQPEPEPAPSVAESPEGAAAEGSGPEDELESEVLSLMRQGQKIQAVKLYREKTGVGDCSLKDAKEAVEAMAQAHGVPVRQAGCASVLLLAAILGGSLVAAFL
jgi:ribosomal protein L7/L12